MGQQHDGDVGVDARKRGVQILTVLTRQHASAMVVDARQCKRPLALAEHDVPVAHHSHAELGGAARPGVRARVVIVVARHEEDPVASAETRKGSDLVAQDLDAPIDQIARHGDQIGIECIHAIRKLLRKVAPQNRTNVNVADLNDAETVERPGPARQAHLDAQQHRGRQAVSQREAARYHADQHDEARARAHQRQRLVALGEGAEERTAEPHDEVRSKEQQQEQKGEAHPDTGDPGEPPTLGPRQEALADGLSDEARAQQTDAPQKCRREPLWPLRLHDQPARQIPVPAEENGHEEDRHGRDHQGAANVRGAVAVCGVGHGHECDAPEQTSQGPPWEAARPVAPGSGERALSRRRSGARSASCRTPSCTRREP